MSSHFDSEWEQLQKQVLGLGECSLRKNHYSSYRYTHEMLEAIYLASPVPIIVMNAEGIVTAWNHAAERVFGWAAEETIGKRLPVVSPEQWGEHRELLARCISGEVFSNIDVQRKNKRGEMLDVRVSGAPLHDATGRVLGVIAVYVDFTECKRLEVQLLQADRLASVGRFAGGIAHDFKNILTVINGYSDLVLAQCRPGVPPHKEISAIAQAGQKGTELTKQLLAFSRKQTLHPRIVDVNSIFADVQQMLPRLLSDDVRVEIDPADEPMRINADPVLIEQVLLNLAVNAGDAMLDGGILTIRAGIHDDCASARQSDCPDEMVEISVKDTGCGMDENVREHMFEPFFTTKEVGKGTGLGLSMAWGIVTQSGGSIVVESELGRGTTFRLLFPRVLEETVQPAALLSQPNLTYARGRILLVEDQAPIRQLVSEVLTRDGHEVTGADCAASALKLYRERAFQYDLLISDSVMPGMSGLELTRRLQSTTPGLKALLISGYATEMVPDPKRALYYLEKPFTPEQLIRQVGEILSSEARERRLAG